MEEPLVFTDATKYHEEPVKVDGALYTLREAFGDAAIKFKSAQARAMRFVDGKPTLIEGAAEVEPLLVHLCLFESYGDPNNPRERNVSMATIKTWKAHVITKIFERAKKISRLDETLTSADVRKKIAELQKQLEDMERAEEEKNSPPTELAGST